MFMGTFMEFLLNICKYLVHHTLHVHKTCKFKCGSDKFIVILIRFIPWKQCVNNTNDSVERLWAAKNNSNKRETNSKLEVSKKALNNDKVNHIFPKVQQQLLNHIYWTKSKSLLLLPV